MNTIQAMGLVAMIAAGAFVIALIVILVRARREG
jgi:hypothetical protein